MLRCAFRQDINLSGRQKRLILCITSAANPVFELPEGGWSNPQLFLAPSTLSNYLLAVSYILY